MLTKPISEEEKLFREGFSAYQKGDTESAVKYYKQAMDEGHSEAGLHLAILYYTEMNEYEQALELLQSLHTTHPQVSFNIGFVFELMKENTKAETYYKLAVKAGVPIAHIQLGQIYEKSEQNTKAIMQYQIALIKGEHQANLLLARLFEKIGETEQAKHYYIAGTHSPLSAEYPLMEDSHATSVAEIRRAAPPDHRQSNDTASRSDDISLTFKKKLDTLSRQDGRALQSKVVDDGTLDDGALFLSKLAECQNTEGDSGTLVPEIRKAAPPDHRQSDNSKRRSSESEKEPFDIGIEKEKEKHYLDALIHYQQSINQKDERGFAAIEGIMTRIVDPTTKLELLKSGIHENLTECFYYLAEFYESQKDHSNALMAVKRYNRLTHKKYTKSTELLNRIFKNLS